MRTRSSLLFVAAVLPAFFAGAGCISLVSSAPSKPDRKRLDAMVEKNLASDPSAVLASVPAGTFIIPLRQKVLGKFFLNARLNGRQTELLMDWGGGTALGLTPRTTLAVHARLSDKVENSSWIDASEQDRLGIVDKMELGKGCVLNSVPLGMSNANMDVVALGFIPVFRGQGLVGMPLLASFRKFAVDFRRSELILGTLPEELLRAGKRHEIPIAYRDSHIRVPMEIQGKAYEMLLDIGGFNGGISLDGNAASEFIKGHAHTDAGAATGSGRNAVGIFLSNDCPFKAGNYGGKTTLILMPDAKTGGDGTIGNAFFGKTLVGVDLEAGKLYFLPAEK